MIESESGRMCNAALLKLESILELVCLWPCDQKLGQHSARLGEFVSDWRSSDTNILRKTSRSGNVTSLTMLGTFLQTCLLHFILNILYCIVRWFYNFDECCQKQRQEVQLQYYCGVDISSKPVKKKKPPKNTIPALKKTKIQELAGGGASSSVWIQRLSHRRSEQNHFHHKHKISAKRTSHNNNLIISKIFKPKATNEGQRHFLSSIF